MKPFAAALAAGTLLLTGCAPAESGAPGGPEDGATAAQTTEGADELLAFTGTTLSGESLDVAALAGEPLVLWFWAPWCTICRAEGPEVAAAAAESSRQVTFIGVAGLGARSDMSAFVDDTGTGHFDHLVDGDGSLWRRFGVVSQPAFVFVSADGSVETFAGALSGEDLRAAVGALASG